MQNPFCERFLKIDFRASDYVEDLAGNRKYLKNTYTEERVEFSKELA